MQKVYKCRQAGRKLSLLVRICKFMTIERRRMLMKAFTESQFGYCPLAWMCCNRSCNNRINHLHERALKIFIITMSHQLKIYYREISQLAFIIEIFAS